MKHEGEIMTHTKGPWEVRKRTNADSSSLWRDIVSMGLEYKPSYVGEALEQDAALIACAPDLLNALIECHEPSKHEPEGCDVCAIIKRAGGQ